MPAHQKDSAKGDSSKSEEKQSLVNAAASGIVDVLKEKIEEFFTDVIPEEAKVLPNAAVLGLGFFAQSLFLAIFIGFLITGYNEALKSEFISLDKNSGVCKEVAKAFSGPYMASYNGYWEGDVNFRSTDAPYLFSFFSMSVDDSQFKNFISQVNAQITAIGNKAKSLPLPINLLYWTNYLTSIDVGNSLQQFQFTGTPNIVYNSVYYDTAVGSVTSSGCSAETNQYETTTGIIHSTWPMNDTISELCHGVSFAGLGFDAQYAEDAFTFAFDYIAASVVNSVNLGITSIDQMELVYVLSDNYQTNSGNYTISSYVDPRFPEMSPVVCFKLISKPVKNVQYNLNGRCAVIINPDTYVFAYPFIHHYEPKCNSCPIAAADLEDCNKFDIINGLVYYDNAATNSVDEDSILNLFEFMDMYSNAMTMNTLSYQASLQILSGNASAADFKFCNVSTGATCSIFSANSYVNIGVYGVSDFYYPVSNGACNNAFSSPQFNNLGADPPTQLTEQYYKCTPKPESAFQDQVGIAQGNAGTIMPLFMSVFIPALLIFLNSSGKLPPPEEFSKDDKLDAVAKLGELILKAKNNGNQHSSDTLVNRLAQELARLEDKSNSEVALSDMKGKSSA